MQVEFSEDDHVMWIRLNRPEKLNAITLDMASQLRALIERANANPAIRVVILSGSGRAFCSGRDITEPPNPAMLELVQQVSSSIVLSPKIFVAAVQGWAVGAGLEWILNCDVTLFAQSARGRFPEVTLGVFASGGALALLPRIVGLLRAKALLLLGTELTADQMKQWGIASELVPDAELYDRASSLGRQLAGYSPDVVSRFKRALNLLSLGDFDQALQMENQMHRELGH